MNTNTTESNQTGSLSNAQADRPDFDKFQAVLQIVIDGEASPEEVAFVEHSISSCSNCSECYELYKSLKDCVQEKIQKRVVPTDLINCIKAKINE